MMKLTFLLLALSASAYGSNLKSHIKCSTAFEEKVFTIGPQQIAFHESEDFKNSRAISSLTKVRTFSTHKGFTKVLYVDGQKNRIHIQDLEHFSDRTDHLTIVSQKGHIMTYPLTCETL